MRFGAVPPHEAEGAILAHSLSLGGTRLRKGRVLSGADVAAITAAGLAEVVVARLDPGDIDEDAAAAAVARALAPEPDALGLSPSAPFAGRVNLFAAEAGVLRIDADRVGALNAIDPAITLATLPDWSRVEPRQLVATVKIIPFALPLAHVEAAAHAGAAALRLHPFRPLRAALILTETPGMKAESPAKGAAAVAARLRRLGLPLAAPVHVAHAIQPLAAAIAGAAGDIVLILTASATSDPADVGPAALCAAGGRLERVGMPVDPGNLLFLGAHRGRPVVGLPGCARSPALNGADWVLERLAAGLEVSSADLARMGAGGLLKEIPSRPQPRASEPSPRRARPRVEAVVLAAGAARRMGGRDKLLEPVGGRPLVAAVLAAASASHAARVIVVLPPDAPERHAAVAGSGAEVVVAPNWHEGLAASLRAGLGAVSADADAVVVLLADMPEVTAAHIDRLIAAFDPAEGREICRALDASGRSGHPVLFGRRFFESLRGLSGDRGARDLLREAEEFVIDVPTPGRGASLDLDTPQDWAAWRESRSA